MAEYTFCKKCNANRYVEGFTRNSHYIYAGWVKEEFTRTDMDGIFFELIEWICPSCRTDEMREEHDKEKACATLLEDTRKNDPALYEKIMRERAS